MTNNTIAEVADTWNDIKIHQLRISPEGVPEYNQRIRHQPESLYSWVTLDSIGEGYQSQLKASVKRLSSRMGFTCLEN
jgi:hypothetical protein